MKKQLLYCVLSVILVFYSSFCTAQYTWLGNENFIYHFDLPNGVEGNSVQDIHQDTEGMMWFASENGLVRFDGNNFKTFQKDYLDENSISHSYTECIYESKDSSTLWIGTWGGGLNKLDKRTQTFTRFQANEGKNSITNDFVADIVEDKQGYIWVGTRNGLNRLNPKTGKIKQFLYTKKNKNPTNYNNVRTLYIDSQGVLWVGTGFPLESLDDLGGLHRYDSKTETFTFYQHDPNDPKSISNNKVTAIFEDSQHNFWVGTGQNRIHLMNRETGAFELQAELSKFEDTNSEVFIRSFTEDSNGQLWIGSYGSGLKNYDIKNSKESGYVYWAFHDKATNPINFSWLFYESRDGTKWISTGNIGRVVFKSKKTFPFLGLGQNDDTALSCFQNQMGDIWMGKKDHGLYRIHLNQDCGPITYIDDPKNPKEGIWSLTSDKQTDIFSNLALIYEDKDSVLWLGKSEEAKGLMRLEIANGHLKYFLNNPNDNKSISGNTILDITEQGNKLWIATKGNVLNQLDKKTEKFKRFTPDIYKNSPQNPTKLLLKNNTLWMGSIHEQKELILSRLDTKTETFTAFSITSIPLLDSTFRITNIVESTSGEIWIGADRSLSKLNPKDNTISHFPFGKYNISRGKSMLMDDYDNIWLTTSSGISVFNTKEEVAFTYPPEYKIHGLPYNFRAATKGIDGNLYFGGEGGTLVVDSLSIQSFLSMENQPNTIASHKVQITDFLLNNELQKQGDKSISTILSSSQLTLQHDENIFSFQLALIDFNNPDLNKFAFFLENYDKFWRKAEKSTAYYSNIPPGEYTFRLKGINYQGEWGEAKPIHITILPPWWQTWWAYSLYSLLVLGIIYGIYRFQLRRQLAEDEAQRLQELDVAKTRLYTNMTHEFRTPLTVILGIANQLKGKIQASQYHELDMIARNGEHLLNLVNQMLDLSKLESGQMAVHMQQSDVIIYLKYIAESFHSFAESRNVKIHFLSDLEELNMDFDVTKIQQIISNLLSNAIKFTPSGGDIYVSVKKKVENGDFLSIKIKDTGVGIAEDRLPHIFKRFYQVDDSNTKDYQGTGIGLALVYELIKLLEGRIEVNSKIAKGSQFSLFLPIRQKAPLVQVSQMQEKILRINYNKPQTILDPVSKNDMPTILVVEDNPDVRQYIQSCLLNQYHLISAENGQMGIEKAIEFTPDLIISDVMMPKKDGYTLCKELKTDQRTSHIPIIMLTAKADMDSKLQGLKQGADAYLAKPFNPQELYIRIDKLLELRQKLQKYYRSLVENSSQQDTKEVETLAFEDTFVLKIQNLILEHIDDYDLDVEKICRSVNMSRSQLHRKLSALTGLSTNRFIRQIRLNKAKELLQNPETSVTAAAFDTGFNDPGYFARVFKKEVGLTPSEWQQKKLEITN